jgi:hypothetical protein
VRVKPEPTFSKKSGVNDYFKNYKQILSKLQKMDTILTHKAQGLLKPPGDNFKRISDDPTETKPGNPIRIRQDDDDENNRN